MSASGESSTTMHRLIHTSGSHPISPPDDPKTNQYNQDLGLIHSTNGNHLESPNEGSSIDHQALSVIPRESWGDVVISFTMVRWLGYLKLLQMGNADPNNKTGKEVRGKASASNGSQIKSPLYHGLSTGKSSVRDHRGPSAHHSSVVDTRIR
ncbi:myb124 [Dorcoceras hygrometricum]|uniref:Myb124 n=1 Tax=Dorcoceras hygrometricum TaxID=472368 RepID=A0A2Z7DEC8_9LAMI|nr:myb124 [Dorcoceras hygrometricum]